VNSTKERVGLRLSEVIEELLGETAWVGEREEMATWEVVDARMQSFPSDATPKFEWENRSRVRRPRGSG
jgi:hypothetical protein